MLLIDADPQASLTISLGYPQPDKLPFTLADGIGRILMDEPLSPGEGIIQHPEGVDLMPELCIKDRSWGMRLAMGIFALRCRSTGLFPSLVTTYLT